MCDTDEYVDVYALVDHITEEEDAADMHHSLYSIPSYWRPKNRFNKPANFVSSIIITTKENSYAE